MTDQDLSREQKLEIVLEGLHRHTDVADLCEKHGISDSAYYNWRKEFIETGKIAFLHGTPPQRERQLAQENQELKGIIDDLTVEVHRLRRIDQLD